MPFMTNIFNEYKREGDEKLSIKQHLENIRPYLHDMILILEHLANGKLIFSCYQNMMMMKVSQCILRAIREKFH